MISEGCSTAAVPWNQAGISALELLTLAENQAVLMRPPVELPGLVASGLTITGDGGLLALTVEGPDLPRAVEVMYTDIGQVASPDPERAARLAERARARDLPELVHCTARDGLELSGWFYRGTGSPRGWRTPRSPRPCTSTSMAVLRGSRAPWTTTFSPP